MSCRYVKKGGASGNLTYCKSPYYCGGSSEQLITSGTSIREYCFGNHRNCPSYNNAYIGSSKSERIKKDDSTVTIVIIVAIVVAILYFVFK